MVQSPTFYDKAIPNLRTTSVTVLEIKSHIESKKRQDRILFIAEQMRSKVNFPEASQTGITVLLNIRGFVIVGIFR